MIEQGAGARLRATERADATFGVWTKSIAETKRSLVQAIVGEAGLSTRSKNQLKNALLWIQLGCNYLSQMRTDLKSFGLHVSLVVRTNHKFVDNF